MISVIIPVYNAELYLGRCIESVLSQTYTDLEILLIDDGSSDSSGEICDRYAALDNRISVIHKENGGVSSARNLGIKKASGKWISFIDADDWVESNFLKAFINNTISHTADLYVQGFIYENNGTSVTWKNESLELVDGAESLLSKPMRGAVWNKLFDSSIINNWDISFNTHLRFLEDECFILEYLLHVVSICFIEGYQYHYLEPQWSTKYEFNNILSHETCYRKALELGALDNASMGVYANEFLDAIVESASKNLISRNQYHQKIELLDSYSGPHRGTLNWLATHCPTLLSYNLIRLNGLLAKKRT